MCVATKLVPSHIEDKISSSISLQLDVNTVAAGGGSRLFFRSGMFVVGPESAGAHPGKYNKLITVSLLNTYQISNKVSCPSNWK